MLTSVLQCANYDIPDLWRSKPWELDSYGDMKMGGAFNLVVVHKDRLCVDKDRNPGPVKQSIQLKEVF